MKLTRPELTWAWMFSRRPLDTSSTTRTCAPREISASTRFEPMNDAPPVTNAFLCCQISASRRVRSRRFFDDPCEFFKLRYSSIFFSGFTGTFTHDLEATRVTSERANGRGNVGGAIRVSDKATFILANYTSHIALLWRDS